jgi:hypothetical protein
LAAARTARNSAWIGLDRIDPRIGVIVTPPYPAYRPVVANWIARSSTSSLPARTPDHRARRDQPGAGPVRGRLRAGGDPLREFDRGVVR